MERKATIKKSKHKNVSSYKHDDRKSCETICTSVTDIIRYSLNQQFRHTCYNILQVSNTNDGHKEMLKNLEKYLKPYSEHCVKEEQLFQKHPNDQYSISSTVSTDLSQDATLLSEKAVLSTDNIHATSGQSKNSNDCKTLLYGFDVWK